MIEQPSKGQPAAIYLFQRGESIRQHLFNAVMKMKISSIYDVGLNDDLLLDAEQEANNRIEKNEFSEAISIYEDTYEEIDEENLQVRSALLERIIEIGLMSGNIQIVSKYSKEYFKNLQTIVDIYKKTQIMKFSKGRDKIYNLEQAIKAGESGSIIVFMQALKSGQLKPREIEWLEGCSSHAKQRWYKME